MSILKDKLSEEPSTPDLDFMVTPGLGQESPIGQESLEGGGIYRYSMQLLDSDDREVRLLAAQQMAKASQTTAEEEEERAFSFRMALADLCAFVRGVTRNFLLRGLTHRIDDDPAIPGELKSEFKELLQASMQREYDDRSHNALPGLTRMVFDCPQELERVVGDDRVTVVELLENQLTPNRMPAYVAANPGSEDKVEEAYTIMTRSV